MGTGEYGPLAERYRMPIVVTGFEPVDLLQGILMAVRQLERGRHHLENQYSRVVRPEGNPEARQVIEQVFERVDREWRGIGTIGGSGWAVRPELAEFDADRRFSIPVYSVPECPDCIAGLVLKGIRKPFECSQFAKGCTPQRPLGAPMVSSEGACAAYYHFADAAHA